MGQKCVYAGEALEEGSDFAKNMVRFVRNIAMVKAYSNFQEDRVSRIEGKLEQLIDYITYVSRTLFPVAI